ncbi:MAG TPA: iron-containing alcohol dehydrogenase [Candidatus Paceibacterota bacterium]|nr:iron-containing alcohol dehydrogenase [Verrucomicrobiota bacterium]HRY48541.1 iron-containing alcohol dehydrogenase [Candidatus Paceibacterota bacterium]HRZ99548.1 iron-containing alcohol dehydrogenase [Candidatus Paceibacterota bacterium]
MNLVTLLQPPRVVLGNGCAPQCADYLAQRGVRRVLLVSSTPVRPTLGPVRDALRTANLTILNTEPVDCEPTCAMFEQMLVAARGENIEAILGVGGGSVIDVAKLLAAVTRGTQTVAEVFGCNLLAGRALPLVCLPTTSGTGAEVSPNAILLDEATALKKGVVSPHLVPDAAFIDPLLTLTVPPSVTAATGLDALTHCIEAFANQFSHPAVDLYALQGIRLIAAHLERAVHNGQDLEARAALALGSFYGGLCLGPVNTGAVHALSYPLGGRFHIAHGVANALLLPHVIRFNTLAAPERYAGVALALGVPPAGSAAATAERGVEFIARLSRRCGVPQTLSEIKIARDAIPSLAQAAMQVTRLLKNNLRPVAEADAVAIYEASF